MKKLDSACATTDLYPLAMLLAQLTAYLQAPIVLKVENHVLLAIPADPLRTNHAILLAHGELLSGWVLRRRVCDHVHTEGEAGIEGHALAHFQ